MKDPERATETVIGTKMCRHVPGRSRLQYYDLRMGPGVVSLKFIYIWATDICCQLVKIVSKTKESSIVVGILTVISKGSHDPDIRWCQDGVDLFFMKYTPRPMVRWSPMRLGTRGGNIRDLC